MLRGCLEEVTARAAEGQQQRRQVGKGDAGRGRPAGVVVQPASCARPHLPAPLSRLPRKRRGAINSKQLTYLEKYRPKQRLRFKEPHAHKTKCCVM